MPTVSCECSQFFWLSTDIYVNSHQVNTQKTAYGMSDHSPGHFTDHHVVIGYSYSLLVRDSMQRHNLLSAHHVSFYSNIL
jgi:hypothetical protein